MVVSLTDTVPYPLYIVDAFACARRHTHAHTQRGGERETAGQEAVYLSVLSCLTAGHKNPELMVQLMCRNLCS